MKTTLLNLSITNSIYSKAHQTKKTPLVPNIPISATAFLFPYAKRPEVSKKLEKCLEYNHFLTDIEKTQLIPELFHYLEINQEIDKDKILNSSKTKEEYFINLWSSHQFNTTDSEMIQVITGNILLEKKILDIDQVKKSLLGDKETFNQTFLHILSKTTKIPLPYPSLVVHTNDYENFWEMEDLNLFQKILYDLASNKTLVYSDDIKKLLSSKEGSIREFTLRLFVKYGKESDLEHIEDFLKCETNSTLQALAIQFLENNCSKETIIAKAKELHKTHSFEIKLIALGLSLKYEPSVDLDLLKSLLRSKDLSDNVLGWEFIMKYHNYLDKNFVLEYLQCKDQDKIKIIEYIDCFGEPEDFPLLLPLCKDRDNIVQEKAIKALINNHWKCKSNLLKELLENDDQDLKYYAWRLLMNHGTPKLLTFIKQYLNHKDPVIRNYANCFLINNDSDNKLSSHYAQFIDNEDPYIFDLSVKYFSKRQESDYFIIIMNKIVRDTTYRIKYRSLINEMESLNSYVNAFNIHSSRVFESWQNLISPFDKDPQSIIDNLKEELYLDANISIPASLLIPNELKDYFKPFILSRILKLNNHHRNNDNQLDKHMFLEIGSCGEVEPKFRKSITSGKYKIINGDFFLKRIGEKSAVYLGESGDFFFGGIYQFDQDRKSDILGNDIKVLTIPELNWQYSRRVRLRAEETFAMCLEMYKILEEN